MSELNSGLFRGTITAREFNVAVDTVAAFAEEERRVAGFVVQRHGKSPYTKIGEVQYPGAADVAANGVRSLIPEDAYGNVGVFVTGRPSVPGERLIKTIVPTPEDLAEFQELLRDNPHMIRGVVTPERLSGSLGFFWREQEPGSLAISGLDETYPGTTTHELYDKLAHIGLNGAYLQFPGGGGDDQALFGMPRRYD